MFEKYAILKVMQTVLMNPSVKFSIKDAAKAAGVSTFAASEALEQLHTKNMVLLEKIGRTHQYKANLDSFLTRQWKIIFSLEELGEAKLVERVLKKASAVSSITLYGSCAIGTDNEKSDFDLLLIAEADSAKKRSFYSEASGTKREVNMQIYSPIEWRQKAEKNKIFYEQVVINSICLYGEKPVVL